MISKNLSKLTARYIDMINLTLTPFEILYLKGPRYLSILYRHANGRWLLTDFKNPTDYFVELCRVNNIQIRVSSVDLTNGPTFSISIPETVDTFLNLKYSK